MQPDQVSASTVDDAIQRLAASLDEKQRRRFVGLLAAVRGHGGVTQLAALTGLSRTTVIKGRREVLRGDDPYPDRVRRPGGGRKPAPKEIGA